MKNSWQQVGTYPFGIELNAILMSFVVQIRLVKFERE
jgi:hypothetical protein